MSKSVHDPLCPTDQNDDPTCWFCELIRQVRSDEREFCCADTESRTRKQVAEEIARAIETEARERQSTRLQAYAAAAIARRIGGAS